MDNTELVRTAAYLAEVARLDARRRTGKTGQVKCNPPNRQCGDRCIPPNWKCRVSGEGTDSHSRVVAGDPLAGAASIARGKQRLLKGIKTGSITDIQGGRAAIERGIVKAVPGQNIKEKQNLRKNVNRVLLPVATSLFGLWALNRGHEGLKLLVPQYRNGIAKDIEDSLSTAVNWGLDRVPLLGRKRIAERRLAAVQTQGIGNAVARSVNSDPENPATALRYINAVSPRERGKISGLATQIENVYSRNKSSKYAEFRADLASTVIGANNQGQSLYSEVAASQYLARQFSLDHARLLNYTGIEAKGHVIAHMRATFVSTRNSLRADMQQRGLDPKNVDDIAKYIPIARANAAEGLRSLNMMQREQANTEFDGFIRDLAFRGKNPRDEQSVNSIATNLFNKTQAAFDRSFKDLALSVREVTDPATAPPIAGTDSNIIRDAYINTANRAKVDVGLGKDYAIRGASHADLVLQKVFNEKVTTGKYSSRSTKTWYANTESVVRRAANDMGWDGTDINDAYTYLQQNGFPRLQRRPSTAKPTQAPSSESSVPPGQPRTARRRRFKLQNPQEEQTFADIIARELSNGATQAQAEERARYEVARRRTDAEDSIPERVQSYLLTRASLRRDLKGDSRLGKPCGASHIPKDYNCNKGNSIKTASNNNNNNSNTSALALGALGVGAAVGVTALMRNPKLQQRVRVQSRLIARGTDKTLRTALILTGRGSIAGLSAKQIKQGLDQLPSVFQEPARKLVGAAKQGAAAMALKAEGFTIQDIDVANNFSTWKSKKGTLISIGSYGDSLVTYASDNSHSWNGKRVYKIGFNVDQNFDATRDISSSQAKAITTAVKKMTDNHLRKINDGILATFPWDGDDYGAKRRAIYSRAGFNNIVGEESQWALVEKGNIKKMTNSQAFLYLAESGESNAPIYKPTKRERKDSIFVKVNGHS